MKHLDEIPTYTVQKGDSMWRIAHKHGLSLAELQKMNPQIKNNTIFPDDKVNLDYKYNTKLVNLKDEERLEADYNKSNISAIQHAPHDSNYVIVDKKNRLLQIYDRNNKLLYQTNDISTGKGQTDFNTVTYTGGSSIQNYTGNNSTPAGILKISGVGTYHGAPSFTRARFDADSGKINKVNYNGKLIDDNVASSFHVGNTDDPFRSNGCVRIGEKALKEMSKYLSEGDITYTLPTDDKSRFILRGGKLNYVADNPYGNTEKGHMSESGHDMVNWDDYNVHIDKSYSPLKIVAKNKKTPSQPALVPGIINGGNISLSNKAQADITAQHTYDNNVKDYANSIVKNKKLIQHKLNLTSHEYNKLAQLAMGIAEQESKFGTATSYNVKDKILGDIGVDISQGVRNVYREAKKNPLSLLSPVNILGNLAIGANEANSKGFTQIKYSADIKNKELKRLYNDLGINENSLKSAKGSAVATMIRLAHIYNTEIKGRNFKDADNNNISPYDALLYKYQGKHKMLKNGKATPTKNNYINNVKRYLDEFDYYEERKYRD